MQDPVLGLQLGDDGVADPDHEAAVTQIIGSVNRRRHVFAGAQHAAVGPNQHDAVGANLGENLFFPSSAINLTAKLGSRAKVAR